MKRAPVIQLIPIFLLILAVCTPIIYATMSSLSGWEMALITAWMLLILACMGLIVVKWR